jgi:hypothetical protein
VGEMFPSGLGAFTTSVTVAEVLPLLLASQPYMAVRLCGAAKERVEVMKVAVPLLTVLLPNRVPPSRNVTVPVAAPGVTVAVRVTGWPNEAGLGETVRTVVVFPLATVSITVAEVLVANLLSPPYTAESEWLPAGRLEVVKIAVPLLSVWLPIVAVPSMKFTDPVAPAGATVAVKVTVWPNVVDAGVTERSVVVGVRGTVPTDSVTEGEVLPRKLASPL